MVKHGYGHRYGYDWQVLVQVRYARSVRFIRYSTSKVSLLTRPPMLTWCLEPGIWLKFAAESSEPEVHQLSIVACHWLHNLIPTPS